MKAQILPDEETLSTPIEIMSSCKAAILIVVVSIFLTGAAVCSFVPKNTNYQITRVQSLPIPSTDVANRAQFKHFTPLNSFAILSVIPYVSDLANKHTITAQGFARLYDDEMKVISTREINTTEVVGCEKGRCDEIIVTDYNFVNFSSVSLVVNISSATGKKILRRADITCTSLNTPISITLFVMISAMTLVLIIFLGCVAPKRLYPTRKDHWSTLFLGLAALCIDGPWLILKYYSVYWFSNIYDIMPELFHMVFILFVMSFFNSLTHSWANRIFSSWLIGLCISFGLSLIIILQSIAINHMPLNTYSVYIKNSDFKIPIWALTAIYHLIILFIMVLGIITVQIKEDATLVLVSLCFILLEVLDCIRAGLRFFCPRSQLGFSFASDVFYILFANFVTCFFIYGNLPIEKALFVEKREEMKQTQIADTDPQEIVNIAEDEDAKEEPANQGTETI